MDKRLQKIREQNEVLLGDIPEQKATLQAEIADAVNAQNRAKEKLEKVETESDYIELQDEFRKANLKEQLARNALRNIDKEPRMKEKDYLLAISVCKDLAYEARDEFRAIADKAITALKDAQRAYFEKMEEVNSTLCQLDEAANVLQQRPIRKGERWEKYATRFTSSDATELFAQDTEDKKTYWIPTYCAALKAVRLASNERWFAGL